MRRWLLGGLILFLVLVVGGYLFWRSQQPSPYGPLIALCPGPDYYGYTCENGSAYAYINATEDTFLYALDGTITLALPFPFTFYGTTYTELTASSNGNVQFSTDNANYANSCLTPAYDMGDMIAPFWDDLDLRYVGYLETAVVGEAPNRIMVIEWDDVPRYETGEPVTFALQLHEGSNDMVFLYESVTQSDGHNGRKATIGLQSEAQGLALQFGCDQPVVSDAAQIRWASPENPNRDVDGLELTQALLPPTETAVLRPTTQEIQQTLNRHGLPGLATLNRTWLSQSPPRTATWEEADLTGDGQPELIVLQHSTSRYPEHTAVYIFTPSADNQWVLLHESHPGDRTQPVGQLSIAHLGDLTHDAISDVLLQDVASGQLLVFSTANQLPRLTAVAEQCTGNLLIQNNSIIRDGCATPGRYTTEWDGTTFRTSP
jgi:hypothetical protein